MLAALSLVAGLLLTVSGYNVRKQTIDNENWLRFSTQFARIEASVSDQLQKPLLGLGGLKGLYHAAGRFDPRQVRSWVAAQDFSQQYQGVSGFGFMAPNYDVRFLEPQPANDSVWAARSLETDSLRQAIEYAMATGEPALSPAPAGADVARNTAQYLYLLPLYKAGANPQTRSERIAALEGLLFATLDLNALMLPTLAISEGQTDFDVFDLTRSEARVLAFSSLQSVADYQHDRAGTNFLTRQYRNHRSFLIGGRLLEVSAGSSTTFDANIDRSSPSIIAAALGIFSILLAITFWLLMAGRARAQALANSMTRDLDRLAGIVKTTTHLVVLADGDRNIAWVNDAFTRTTGVTLESAKGMPISALTAIKSNQAADLAAFQQTIDAQQDARLTLGIYNQHGQNRWFDVDLRSERDDQGAYTGYILIASDITAQREAKDQIDAALRETQALMDAIDEHSIVSITDAAGTITYANEMFSRISGYTAEELIGKNHRMVKSDIQSDSFWTAMWKTIASGYTWRGTVGNRSKSGNIYWVDTVISPFFDEAGHVVKYVSIRTDVTAAREAQASLHQNNRVMKSIMDNIPVALSVFDSDLTLIAHNQRFPELLEFPEWLFTGSVTTFESLIRFNAARGEYGSDNVEQAIAGIIERARHTTAHQFERVRPNGMALEVRGAPMPGGGFITTYADISERKKAEAEVARTTAMLQSVLDSASEVAVVAMGLDNVISLFNKGAERLLGYDAAEMIGQSTPAVFFDASEVEARSSALSAQLDRQVLGLDALVDESVLGKRNEWTFIRKDGERVAVVLVVTAMTDAQGKRTGYLGVSHDIAQEKAHEARLQIAMEEAEQAAVSKGQFLANMSHEIRTPMNAILGMLKLLQNTPLDARQQDYTSKTESAARALLGLLNDILDFSKSEAGKMQLDPQPFRLDRLMRDLSVILSANVGAKGIEVLFDLDPRLPASLVGDSMRLQQVLINLGGNAIKFTEKGEVVVSIALVERVATEARIRIAVRDSGIGIDPKNQQHIFSGFSQAEASTTRRFGGTGLGLSICKRLVALMGGELQLDSVLGEGSTFHFSINLPVVADAADGDAMHAEPTPMKALVVDDNATARKIISSMALSLGWTVDTAGSGAEALQRIKYRADQGEPPYQAIFMDWLMPEMDGWETTQRIRQLHSKLQAPVVVMVTAHGREMLAQRSEAEQTSLDGFLVKPITASMLSEAVQDALEQLRNPTRVTKTKAAKAKPLAGLRLLVVEDNLINQQVARELLSAEGASIDIAGNGQLGVDAVAAANPQYDAVLMDIQMPVMDGYTAAVTIRHELGLYKLPIIAMTANAMASDREACLAAGMDDHIGKPFDVPQLVALLCRHTGHTPEAAVPPVPAADVAPHTSTVDAADPLPLGEIDVVGALALLGDNAELYGQITQAYLAEIAAMPGQMQDLLQRGELTEASRVLHTIKGLSLTVGAKQLSAVCKYGEMLVKQAVTDSTTPDTLGLQSALQDSVSATTEALRSALRSLIPAAPAAQAATSTSGHSLDVPALLADLQSLERLLAESDMRALEHHTALRTAYAGATGDRLDALAAALGVFDFAQGVVQCRDLIREFSTHN